MLDNFNIHGWRLNQAINEDKSLQVNITDDDWSQSIAYKISDALIKAGYSRDMIKQVAKAILTRPSLQEVEEATFTDKHDDNPELKGGQKDLPDELQAGILKKEGMDHEVSMAQASLKSIISSASELMNKIGNEEINLPGWIQGHITNAENYIDQANQGYHELEPSVKDIDAMDMVTEEVSANKKTKAKNALAIHLRSAMEDGNKENIEQVKDARDRINSTKSVDELVNILGEFGYKDDEIEDILG